MNEKLNISLIKNHINSNGLSIVEFCKLCRISTSTFYRIMQGKDFNTMSIFKIAKEMNIQVFLLFL